MDVLIIKADTILLYSTMLSFFDQIEIEDCAFSNSEAFTRSIAPLLDRTGNPVEILTIGQSEEGRPIHAFLAGRGNTNAVLLAGAHSDEPVGPEMLRILVKHLLEDEIPDKLFENYRFLIIPHINPDGELKNQLWTKQWPDLQAYAAHAFREEPGRDLEFGYPDMRPENRAVSGILKEFGPCDLYINFHGMAFAEGIMLLIERHWTDRTRKLQTDFQALAENHKLPLHDHDRNGEKGFQYIGPGFTTTPEGRAMKKHFLDQGDEEKASKFHLSSMEYIRSLGGDPLCLVTELPLFLVSSDHKSDHPGVPGTYLALKEKLPEIRRRAKADKPLDPVLSNFQIRPLPIDTAIRIQLGVIRSALEQTGL